MIHWNSTWSFSVQCVTANPWSHSRDKVTFFLEVREKFVLPIFLLFTEGKNTHVALRSSSAWWRGNSLRSNCKKLPSSNSWLLPLLEETVLSMQLHTSGAWETGPNTADTSIVASRHLINADTPNWRQISLHLSWHNGFSCLENGATSIQIRVQEAQRERERWLWNPAINLKPESPL